jgi:hypothetical protein
MLAGPIHLQLQSGVVSESNPWSTAPYIATGCADVGSLIAFKRVV